ncbi:MAG: CBS domain-containing protein [Planctomycetaceae bacterium]|nr:CBS domain-containing protein [Planctomycetaceae bacterium]
MSYNSVDKDQLLDADSGGASAPLQTGASWAVMQRLVAGDIMQSRVPAASVNHSVIDAVRMMHEHQLIQLPVQVVYGEDSAERTFIGTVRAKDIFEAIVSSSFSMERAYYDWQVLNLPVSKVMRHKVRSVAASDDLERVISAMSVENLDALMVMDGTRGLGYVRSGAILDVLIRLGNMFQLILGEGLQEMSTAFSLSLLNFAKLLQAGPFAAGRIMTKPTLFLEEQEDMMKAMSIFASGYWRYIPVLTEEGGFAGILCDRDMLKFLAEIRTGDELEDILFDGKLSRSALREKTVREIMQRDVQTIPGEMPLWEACDFVVRNDLRCLAVYDPQNGFCGILSQSDMIRGFSALIQMYPNVMNLLGAEDVSHASAQPLL